MPPGSQYTVTTFPAHPDQNWLGHITAGPSGDNRMWYTAFNAGVGNISTTESTPSPQPQPVVNVSSAGITATSEHVWFTQTYSSLEPGKGPSITGVNTDGSFLGRYSVPYDPTVDEYVPGEGKVRWLWAITRASNGCLYFTERHAGRIGAFHPGPSPSPCGGKGSQASEWATVVSGSPEESDPTDIVQGADGNLYFADYQREKIGCLTLSGDLCGEWAAPGRPWGVASGPDGHVWFTASKGDYLGRLNLDTRTIDRQVILTPGSQPWDITVGPNADPQLWFSLRGSNQIGSLRPDPVFPYPPQIVDLSVFHYPGWQSKPPSGVAVGNDGRVWYTAEDHIGVLTPHAG